MEQREITAIFQEKTIEEVIEILEKEVDTQEEEYAMLKLGQAYLKSGDEKSAKKTIRRLKMYFPSGDHVIEEDELLQAIKNGTTKEYLEKYVGEESANTESDSKEVDKVDIEQNSVSKKKKEVHIPESIAEYFENVGGMKKVQVELDALYRQLRFQAEREEHDLRGQIFKTHFTIAGERGSGKTMLSNIIAQLLCDFGVRENEEPIYISARDVLKAYEGKKGKEDAQDLDGIGQLFQNVQDATVVIENMDDLVFDTECSASLMKDIFVSLEEVLKQRKEELSIVFTGSEKSIEEMFKVHTTIQDLFSNIVIPRYSTMELLEVAEILARDNSSMRLHEDSKKALIQKIDSEIKTPSFENVHTVSRYLDEAAKRMAYRYYEIEDTTERDMIYLMPEDFEVELEEVQTMEEILAELNALVGMESVKTQVNKRVKSASMNAMAKEAGASRKGGHGSLHMMFTGNPGTGKTTVARLIGKIYQSLGILPRGSHVVECTRSELVGQYQGHTAKLVQSKFIEAAGGVLFIDEAYALCRNDNDTFGHEAVDEIIAQMENNRDSLMVILAGYSKEMYEFLDTNPGFKSRIPESNYIHFEDYEVDEMAEIFARMVNGQKMKLGYDTKDAIRGMLEVKSKAPNFGNARGVRNLFEEVVIALNERLYSLEAMGKKITKNQFDIVTKEDIQTVAGRKLESEKTLEELLEELDSLVGLSGAKKNVREMINQVKAQKAFEAKGIPVKGGPGTLHLIFKGNAGTGKTTIARLIGSIYVKLGVLKKNVFVETKRSELVGSYQGQTAPKVIKKVEEADGGILFIDEAYTLSQGEKDTFGHEAIDTLVAELENRRNSLMVIVAGYDDKMDEFLDANQGLRSRLSHTIYFEDYSLDDLEKIFLLMMKQKGLVLENGVVDDARLLIEQSIKKEKDFGNARGVRNIVEDIIRNKNTRIAPYLDNPDEVSIDVLTTIKREDVKVKGTRKKEKTLEELLEELNALTGLPGAKAKVQEMINNVRITQMKKAQGLPVKDGHGTLHLVFTGNAGTGKTTVARLLGKIYVKLGVLKRDVVLETGRADFVAEYEGQTAPKTRKTVEKADGGVLFIDEAYTLHRDDKDPFGKEAVDTLVAEVENRRATMMVILAGYAKDIDKLIQSNQGLESRFRNFVDFEDYTEDELVEIFYSMLRSDPNDRYEVEEGATDVVKELIVEKKKQARDFGNARGVRNLIEDVKTKQTIRLLAIADKEKREITGKEFQLITIEDIKAVM